MKFSWKRAKKDLKVKILYLTVILMVLVIGYFIAQGLYNQLESYSITKTPEFILF